jgi:hypothetical protein
LARRGPQSVWASAHRYCERWRVRSTTHWRTSQALSCAKSKTLTSQDADAYSDALAVGTLDPERTDVLSKIRKDFDAAGVAQSDEQILRVLNELTLQVGNQMPTAKGGAADALTVLLARKLKPE